MKSQMRTSTIVFSTALLLTALACSLPGLVGNTPQPPPTPLPPTETPVVVATDTQPAPTPTVTILPSPTVELPTPTITVLHSLVPSTKVDVGEIIHDVVSVDTAAEKRAPYGDSYDINLLERPFLADMSYIADMDIASYNLSKDEKFYYVSIELVGTNPNNAVGIQYAVELDLDADGYGDIIVVAYPPHSAEWSTDNIKIFRDTNRDTGGLSAAKSDAPLPGNGYDKLIFDGGRGPDDNDPDLAWVRINAGRLATVQFAFKLGLAENRFMYGVIADAGPRDIADLDYVDRFTEEEAGSPVRGDEHYPLKALFGVDNTCRTAQGFQGTYEEPQRCPEE